ncbi:MAG: hypothetical protein IJ235_07170 [Eubacterium sp.]|nr:hypothetical protein [Eubacterium sp.]MBQ8980624.1 hypothetical protein [Eubacterium sp.]MBR1530463.1 hypothetical protein [Eubacterium sp.]MBR2278664.1 hypothetical protein [Eubacterium sp.]
MRFTKQTLYRAARTFLQAALSYMVVNIAAADLIQDTDTLKTTLIGLSVASVAAGLAAVMNLEQ